MMNWSQQAEAMMKSWADAQQQMWSNWANLAWNSPAPLADMTQDWHDMTAQTIHAWTTQIDPTVQNVTEQLFASQNAMMRFLELTTSLWKSLSEQIQNGADWKAALTEQMNIIREQLVQTVADTVKNGASTSGDVADTWQVYLKQWQEFGQPWMALLQQNTTQWGEAMTGNRAALSDLMQLYWDTYDHTFGKLLKTPSMGHTREMEAKLREGFEAWLDVQQAGFEYQTILADTWVKAFERLMREVITMTEQGQMVGSIREFLNRWSTVADSVFKDVFRSEQYIQVQGRFLNATMVYRTRQRAIMEEILTALDLPTRSEVDEAHHQIYELRKEVKALKKELAAMKSPAESKPKAKNRKLTT